MASGEMANLSSGGEEVDTSLAESYALATQNLRSTVRWILAAAAAVGGALVAGLQLTNLGALPLEQWPRLLTAVVGAAIALAAIGSMVYQASRILTDDWITLAQLSLHEFQSKLSRSAHLEGLFEELEVYKAELYGQVADSLPGLYDALRKVNVEERHQTSRSQALNQDAATVRGAVAAVVQFANYFSTRRKFAALSRGLGVSTAVAFIGVLLFAYAANPPAV